MISLACSLCSLAFAVRTNPTEHVSSRNHIRISLPLSETSVFTQKPKSQPHQRTKRHITQSRTSLQVAKSYREEAEDHGAGGSRDQ